MIQIFRFLADEEGATALEYGLLAALIAAAIVASVNNLGQVMIQAFNLISQAMEAIINGGGSGSGGSSS